MLKARKICLKNKLSKVALSESELTLSHVRSISQHTSILLKGYDIIIRFERYLFQMFSILIMTHSIYLLPPYNFNVLQIDITMDISFKSPSTILSVDIRLI